MGAGFYSTGPSKRAKEIKRLERREAKQARKLERRGLPDANGQFPNRLGNVPEAYDGLARTVSRGIE